MTSDSTSDSQDKMRLCPSCRMSISIFATKCRFCGEPVGRPREEARQLTIRDLGGEQDADYVPNKDLVAALEAFRREEESRNANSGKAKRRTWFWTKKPQVSASAKPARDVHGSLPELKAASRDLTDTGGFTRARPVSKRGGSLWPKRLAICFASVLAIVILYLVGSVAKTQWDNYNAAKNRKSVVVVDNPAIAMLESNTPGLELETLKAACEAQAASDIPEYREVTKKAREKVKAEVHRLLNADPWDQSLLKRASSLLNEAEKIDSNSAEFGEIRKEVNKDLYDYTMTIASLNPETGIVTFRSEGSLQKKIGDTVRGRFTILEVAKDYVTLEDTEPRRKTPDGQPRRFRLFLDPLSAR